MYRLSFSSAVFSSCTFSVSTFHNLHKQMVLSWDTDMHKPNQIETFCHLKKKVNMYKVYSWLSFISVWINIYIHIIYIHIHMYIYIRTHIENHINSYKYINIHKTLNTSFFSKMLSMLRKFWNILQNLLWHIQTPKHNIHLIPLLLTHDLFPLLLTHDLFPIWQTWFITNCDWVYVTF